jgi:hypothetical protein
MANKSSQENQIKLIEITKSIRDGKKFKAIFQIGSRQLTVHFGATGYQDYTQHHDKSRRDQYRQRHKNDPINNPITPGALSWHILWGESTNFTKNINEFKRKFGI